MKPALRCYPLLVAIVCSVSFVVVVSFLPVWAKYPEHRTDIFAPLDTFWAMLAELNEKWRDSDANVRSPVFLLKRYWTNIVLAPAVLATGAALGWFVYYRITKNPPRVNKGD